STVNHPGGGTEQKCWRHEAQTNRSAGRGPDIARDGSSEVDTAHCERLTTIRRNFCFVYFEFYRGKDPGKRNAWIILYALQAVADQDDVGWPFGMLRDYSLLGVDAVDQRRPTD